MEARVAVGNKLDLVPPGASIGGEEFAHSIGCPHLFTSARDGLGVEQMFVYLARLAVNLPLEVMMTSGGERPPFVFNWR